MRTRMKTAVAAVAIAGLTVVGTDALTYAGTGDSLILGKVNKSGQTTQITSTGKGPALSLHAKGDRPALAVDSSSKVVKLNADRVDGKDATGLQNNVRVFTANSGSATGRMLLGLPDFPNGRYQVTYQVYMDGTAANPTDPNSGDCGLKRRDERAFAAVEHSTTFTLGLGIGVSASDVLTKTNQEWLLSCSAYETNTGNPIRWSIASFLPVRVTLTRIDKTIGGRLSFELP